MSITRFEDIIAWQRSKELTVEVYRVFRDLRDYGFKDQIQRASVSVMNNIAEGFERRGDKEFLRFLSIAKGSCGEVRSMVILAKELGYITETEYFKLHSLSVETSKLVYAFGVKLRELSGH